MSDAANQWTKFYTTNTEMMYPAEGVIRIFKGEYPNLKMPRPKAGQSILDVGFGDGRHFVLLNSIGLHVSGSEITQQIVESCKYQPPIPIRVHRERWASADRPASQAPPLGFELDLRVGTCAKLPWPDRTFDYLLTWNSCYYMNTGAKFEDHVAEMARVIKPGGWIVCSIPKSDCFIFRDCRPLKEDERYVKILDEHFGLRNGEVMRCFLTKWEMIEAFSSHFHNFCHADIDIDMFGLAYNWHVFTAERKT